MEKIAVIGFDNKDEIIKRYAGKAEFDFDPEYSGKSSEYAYSAVFIKSGQSESVIKMLAWKRAFKNCRGLRRADLRDRFFPWYSRTA